LALVGHGSVAVDPLSPLHPAQVFCVELHTGVAPLHAAISGVVHSTHVADVGLHAGVGAVQLASLAHVSHVPARAPLATQIVDTHARVATARTQLPPGTGWPFDTFGWHIPALARSLHQSAAPHSASVKHALPHAPVVVLQYGLAAEGQGLVAEDPLSPLHATHALALEQTGSGLAQSDEVAHATHVPAPASAVTHTPAVVVGHAWVAADPKFPLHGAHRLVVGSHIGWVAGQSPSRTQPPQLLSAITAGVQTWPP